VKTKEGLLGRSDRSAVRSRPSHGFHSIPASSSPLVKFGGYIGILTALVAWYASAAGVANGVGGRVIVPVGQALWKPAAAAAAAEPAARA